MAGHLSPAAAARACGSAARRLAEALGRGTDAAAHSQLALALAALAVRLDPAEAGRVCKALADALGRETDAAARSQLASALSTVADRLDLSKAALVCEGAIRALLRIRSAAPLSAQDRLSTDRAVTQLLWQSNPVVAHPMARELSALILSETDYENNSPGFGGMGGDGGVPPR